MIFHLDEPFDSVRIAAKPFLYNVTHDHGSVLYQVVTHFLLPLGKWEVVSRLPAVLFGILIIVVTYHAGKLFFGKNIGLAAALFVSLSHYLLSFSQYARGYTILAFLSLLSLIYFYKAIEDNRLGYWILLVIISVLNACTHLISLMTILIYCAFIGILLIEKGLRLNRKKPWGIDKIKIIRFTIFTLATIAITFLLRLPVGEMDGKVSSIHWIKDTLSRLFGSPTIGFFPLVKQILTHHFYQSPSALFFLALFFIFFGFVGCLIRLRRKDVLILLFVTLPFLCFYSIKPLPLFYIGADRYFIFLLPVLFILLAKGMFFLSSLLASWAARIKALKKRAALIRMPALVFFVAAFLLLECFALKGYADYKWKLRTQKVSRDVQTLLQDKVEEHDVIFFESFPNPASFLYLIRFDVYGGKNKVLIYTKDIRFLNENSRQGLWLVMDRLSPGQSGAGSLPPYPEGAEIFDAGGRSVIHWRSGEKTLLNKLMDMTQYLTGIHTVKEREYRLLRAYLRLLEMKPADSLKELDLAEKQEELKDSALVRLVNVFMKDIRNYRNIVTASLNDNIARQLWTVGYTLFSEKKWEEGTAVFERCIELTDEFHVSISTEYFARGKQLLNAGKTGEAVRFLNRAAELNPRNYFIHLILAEAYRQRGELDNCIREYRRGLAMPSLSDEVVQRIVDQPRLFAVWEEKGIWHLMWRAEENTRFSGTISFDHKLGATQTHHFSKKDSLYQSGENAAEFDVSTNKRRIKTLDIRMSGKSALTCDIRMNGRPQIEDVVFLPSGRNPKNIPFIFHRRKA